LLVEGDGEVEAGRELIRRVLYEQLSRFNFELEVGNAQGNGNITTPGGIEKLLERTRRLPGCKGVIVLLDAEKDHQECPPALARELAKRAEALGLPFSVVVACANCEYESWFLASLDTIRDDYLVPDAKYEGDPEQECSAKGWLSRRMRGQRNYKETLDQVKMTSRIDMARVQQNSRSFRRLVHAVEELIDAIDNGKRIVSPANV
jgi:hypothetical protein